MRKEYTENELALLLDGAIRDGFIGDLSHTEADLMQNLIWSRGYRCKMERDSDPNAPQSSPSQVNYDLDLYCLYNIEKDEHKS